MPAYKSQHFVPAAYLRHFSVDGQQSERKSNIYRTRLRGQDLGPVDCFCSSDYFYSLEDAERVEKEFGKIESFYGKISGKFWSKENPKNEREYLGLVIMMLDLHLRSAAYAKQAKDNYQDYLVRTSGFRNQLLFGLRDRPSTEEEIVDHLRQNWKIHMIKAGPGRMFLTSDNPSLLFHRSDSELVQLVLLPITPHFYAVAFDHRAFAFKSATATESDEKILTHLQIKHCVDCIFTAEKLGDECVKGVQTLLGMRQFWPVNQEKDTWIANTHRIPTEHGFDFIQQRQP